MNYQKLKTCVQKISLENIAIFLILIFPILCTIFIITKENIFAQLGLADIAIGFILAVLSGKAKEKDG